MIFIDANLFIAYSNSRDIHHSQSYEILTQIENGKFGQAITSDCIFNEVVGVTLRKEGKGRAILLGNQILKSIFIISVDEHLLREAWAFFTKTSTGLSFVDCTNLITAKCVGAEYLATFDKEFRNFKDITVIC